MKIKPVLYFVAVTAYSITAIAQEPLAGYYGSLNLLHATQSADNIDTSSRPGIGGFVSQKEKERFYSGAIALGYQFGNGWRMEGEYVFKKKTEYTSGSTAFPTSLNHHKGDAQRLMLNVYRDYELGYDIAVYGTVGLGVAKVKSGGWQGVSSRQYADNTQTNLAYAVGAGISYTPIEQLSFDLGYRYVDMGNIQSGYNNFRNARGFQDEQMKADLVSSEVMLSVRYLF